MSEGDSKSPSENLTSNEKEDAPNTEVASKASKKKPTRVKPPFWRNRDALKRWPYALNALEGTLDLGLLQGRGKELLYRALNSQRLVAFIGTGISAAYGRLSWKQLRDRQIDDIRLTLSTFLKTAKAAEAMLLVAEEALTDEKTGAAINSLRGHLKIKRDHLAYRYSELKQLGNSFEALSKEGPALGGDIFPIQFQIAKRLQDGLQAAEKLFIEQVPTQSNARRKPITDPFEQFWWAAKAGYLRDDTSVPFSNISDGNADTDWTGYVMREDLQKLWENGCSANLKTTRTKYKAAFEDYYRALRRRGNNLRFKDMAKHLVYDERAHAEQIITMGLRYQPKLGRQDWADIRKRPDDPNIPVDRWEQVKTKFISEITPEDLVRNVPGITEKPNEFEVLGFFKKEAVDRLIGVVKREKFAPAWHGAIKAVKETQESNETKNIRSFWTPTRRFIVGMLLSRMKDPLGQSIASLDPVGPFGPIDINAPILWKTQDSGEPEGVGPCFHEPVGRSDFRSRRSIIHEDMDPLEQISIDLRIRKFLTTNYDLEIERMLTDRGYGVSRYGVEDKENGREPPRIDGLGGRVNDTFFVRESTDDLLSFVLDLDDEDAGVFHLHGRATANSDIVLTEQDYMDLYLRNDDRRDLVNESIDLAFSANPILFLGIGMNEDDVLRPLRQFISNQERRHDRVAIALMPGNKGKKARRKEASALFTRFGVLAIYYGDALIECEGEQNGWKKVAWMQIFMAVHKAATKINEAQLEALRGLLEAVDGKLDEEAREKLSEAKKMEARRTLGEQSKLVSDLCGVYEAFKRTKALDNWFHENNWPISPDLDDQDEEIFAECSDVFGTDDTSFLKKFFETFKAPHSGAIDSPGPIDVGLEVGLLEAIFGIIEQRDFDLQIRGSSDPELGKYVDKLKRKFGNGKGNRDVLLEAIRDCVAVEVGLEGIKESIYTIMVSSALRKIGSDWEEWWNDWLDQPPKRKAVFEVEEQKEPYAPQFVWSRHQVTNYFITLPDEWTPKDATKDEPITKVRAVDNFLQSVATSAKNSTGWSSPMAVDKRRIFLVAADRGLGKGIFLSALQSPIGLATFLKCSWANFFKCSWTKRTPDYLGAAFVNYSFSSEIASTWDMIVDALKQALNAVGHNIAMGPTGAELTRHGELAYLLALWKENANGKRLLFCFGGIDLLLNERGEVKNGEIEDILSLLNSNARKDVPVDIIYLCDEGRVPRILREPSTDKGDKTEPYYNLVSTPLPDIKPGVPRTMIKRLKNSNVPVLGELVEAMPDDINLPKKLKRKADPNRIIHLARPMRPEDLLVDSFLDLALVLIIGSFPQDQYNKYLSDEQKEQFKNYFGYEIQLDDLSKHKQWDKTEWQKVCEGLLEGAGNFLNEHLNITDGDGATLGGPHTASQIARAWYAGRLEATDESKGDLLHGSKKASDDWLELRTLLRHNRFCFTILLAAAQYATRFADDMQNAKRVASAFLDSVSNQIKAASEERREEIVIGNVIDLYERYSRKGNVRRDVDLHHVILRHLAVIGHPVSADILVRVPAIRHWFDRNASRRFAQSEGATSAKGRRTLELRDAITALESYGLVYRVHAHQRIGIVYESKIDDEDQKAFDRFALHRLVSRHILRKMDGSMVEFVHQNDFGVTLYASMSSELPKPNTEDYRFLRQLIASLSEYPDRHALSIEGEPWHFGTASMPTRVQALRAALGILRTTFSVAVVSRFEEYKTNGVSGIRYAGCFEEHRIQIRWLLRKAFELEHEAFDKTRDDYELEDDPQEKEPERSDDRLRPFYRDEIIWLYNECGIVCSVQGNLVDAETFLRQALALNRDIEGNHGAGAQHCRISLNLAIVQIERGRLRNARKRLRVIRDNTNGKVKALAIGYLGLVHHLRGRQTRAADNYKKALKTLRKHGDSRGISIFARHLGDLERLQKRPKHSKLLLTEAIAAAESGGHEDLYHKAQLSDIRHAIHCKGKKSSTDFLRRLQRIERYADIMDMPTLFCETLHLRAELLLQQGETGLAGKLLKDSIAKSKRNQLNLRLASAITLYGKTMFMRQQDRTGRRLLQASLNMVKSYGFQLEIDRIEKALMEAR